MIKSIIILFCLLLFLDSYSQQDTTSTAQSNIALEDPSNIITRVVLFNEHQKLKSGEFLNVTTARTVVAIGKRFTTRLDIPVAYNSTSIPGVEQFGLGNISLRLLGYRVYGSPSAALLTSIEFSFNTATSPLLGTGKNVIIPTVSYSWINPKKLRILALSFQQFYSLWGDDSRKDISFTRLQGYYIQGFSKKFLMVALPELYIDYLVYKPSMNLEIKAAYRINKRLAVWTSAGAGLFGDHPARYKWDTELGVQYLLNRNIPKPKK